MPKFPVISGKKLLKILKKHGFFVVRQKGSHVFVENEDQTLRTVIPIHGNRERLQHSLSAFRANQTEDRS